MTKLIEQLEDGRTFPAYNGETLSWSPGLYTSLIEQRAGYPRMRAVLRAMKEYRPEQLERERRALLKASFDRMFGNAAKASLRVIEEIIGEGV